MNLLPLDLENAEIQPLIMYNRSTFWSKIASYFLRFYIYLFNPTPLKLRLQRQYNTDRYKNAITQLSQGQHIAVVGKSYSESCYIMRNPSLWQRVIWGIDFLEVRV